MKQIEDILKDLYKDFFKDYEITEPSIEGKACGHKLERMCTFHDCQEFSLHCENGDCDKSYRKHYLCKSITMKGITDLLKQHFRSNKEFLAKMFDIEDAFINDLTKKREEIVKKMSFRNLEEKYEKVIEEIYRKGNGECLKGKEADEFFKKLLFLSKAKNSADAFLQKFSVAAQKASDELVYAKETALNEYLSSIKSVNYVSVATGEFNSAILKKEDLKYQ